MDEEVRVERWRKYGKDRLYVNDPNGRRLGWHDVATGTDHLEVLEHSSAFHTAVARWRSQQPTSLSERAPRHPSAPPSLVASATAQWFDLAAHPPGALAWAQAESIRAAAPRPGFWARLFRLPGPDHSWRVGALGEVFVGEQLAQLVSRDPRWRFLNAIPVGTQGSDIDHVVIGPGGVYTLNTKHHRRGRIWVGGNTLMVNGTRTDYIRNARHEAARASKLLSRACGFHVPVQATVVLIATSLTIRERPADVVVLGLRDLVRWLSGQPDVVYPQTIDLLYDAARRSKTWSSGS